MAKRKAATEQGNSADVSAVPQPPVLVPQPHGGALLTGGKPGNRGGGRKPSALKRTARALLHNRRLIHRLADIGEAKIGEIVDTKDGRVFTETPLREQRGAIEALIRLGVTDANSLNTEEVKARVRATVALIRADLSEAVAEPLIDKIAKLWPGF